MTQGQLVLIVDDEAGILSVLRTEMAAQGFRVVTARGAEQALEIIGERHPDIVLLGVDMPDMTGLQLMRELKSHSNLPVILVTGKAGRMDKVQGLELGADDYIVKPFSPEEVAARVRAVLRRGGNTEEIHQVVLAGDIEIDLTRRMMLREGVMVPLTRNEWQLLAHLASHPGKPIATRDLLRGVWGNRYEEDIDYARVWISRLRQKLEKNPGKPEILTTVPGIGYLFNGETTTVATA